MNKSKNQNFFFSALLAFFVLLTFLAPYAVRAQGGVVQLAPPSLQNVGTTAIATRETANLERKEDLERQAEKRAKQVRESVTYNLIANGLIPAASMFLNRLAYKFASELATGGKGGTSLVELSNWRDYFEYAGGAAVGEFLGRLSNQPWNKIGFDFCNPNFKIKLILQLAQFHEAEPEPLCQWSVISANYSAIYDKFKEDPGKAVLSLAGFQFKRGQSELGIALSAHDTLYKRVWQNDREAVAKREEGNGFKPVLGGIAGNVRTPASVFENQLNEQSRDAKKASDIHVTSFLTNSSLYGQFGAVAGAVFVNTLAEKLLTRFFEGFLPDIPVPPPNIPRPGLLANTDDQGGAGLISSSEVYGELLTVQFSPPTNYNPVNEFVSCNPEFRGANHCVMDQQFAAAVSSAASGEPLTVRQALNKKFLHANWPLISTQDPRNGDPIFCTTGAYCESNLKKLRLARIIPIGWELAAALSPVGVKATTLGEAINNFSNCNANSNMDAAHPYCHLVDPGWVIKLPLTQCRIKLSGATRIAQDSSARELLCVDAQTCIEENEKGECIGGYGYCEREKTVWRLGGDHCPAQLASCLTLNARKGGAVNYLLDSVDVGACNETNVGCTGYSTTQNITGAWSAEPSVYLDKDAVVCEGEAAGCTELISRKGGVQRNLIPNGSFETDSDNNNFPDDWFELEDDPSYAVYLENATGNALGGTDAVRIVGTATSGGLLSRDSQSQILLLPSTTYTASVYAKLGENAILPESNLPVASLQLGVSRANFTGQPTNCNISVDGDSSDPVSLSFLLSPGNLYQRFSCTFTLPAGTSSVEVQNFSFVVPANTSLGTNGIIIDSVQLEEGSAPTPYIEGGQYGAVTNTYLKIAPNYLGCTGEAGESEECKKYAHVCRVDEVGCELYTPKNGDPGIPGIVGSGDRCPQECVGYDTFKQEATALDPTERFPLFFIPSTARACSAAVVGCDEFTNLDTASVGREAKEYFTDLRVCQKPGNDTRTYYTWEGSDTVGYQLRTWSLKKSNLNNGPCTQLNSANPSICDDPSDSDPLELPAGSPGGCTAAEVTTNPDCREFYDSSENIYRRLYTRTIVSTADCHPYRKTESTSDACSATNGAWNSTAGTCIYNVYPAESGQCAAAQNGCRAFTGDTGRNTFDVFNTNFESGTAEGWSNGAPSSESLNVGGSSFFSTAFSIYQLGSSSSSTIRQGGTYVLEFWAKGIGSPIIRFAGAGTTNQARFFAGGSGGAPIVSLGVEWQKYSLGPIEVDWTPLSGESLGFLGYSRLYLDNVILREVNESVYVIKDSWNTPASCDETLDGATLPQAMLGCEEYQDRASAAHYLKSFTQLCREESVGCEAFINTQNSSALNAETYNVYCQLADACTNANGCSCPSSGTPLCTVVNTMRSCSYKTNDDGPTDTCGAGDNEACRLSDTVTVRADQNITVVNSPDFACDRAAKGCSALGEHKINQVCTLADADICEDAAGCPCTESGSICEVALGERSCIYTTPPGLVNTKYLLNQPDAYGETFCSAVAEGCESYSYQPTGQLYYFKTPQEQLCDFRDNVILVPGSSPVRGWFKKGTTDPCGYVDTTPGNTDQTRSPYLIGGGQYGLWKNADSDYEGFVGECEKQQSGCTEFVDSFDTSPEHASGRPYFYLKNDKISAGDCNGQVNPQEGCVLLRDTSNPALTYNVNLSYARSNDQGDIKVLPVNCATDAECELRCSYNSELGATICTGGFENNTNSIIKVLPDRACTEWLACQTSVSVFDPTTGSSREVCTQYGRCLEYSEGGSGSTCVRFALPSNISSDNLTAAKYADRNTTFSGSEYSGYSIPGLRPVPSMRIQSSTGNLHIAETAYEALSCRGFPEEVSPFPTELAQFDGRGEVISSEQGWSGVNICEPGESGNCQCNYTKVSWGPVVRYRDFQSSSSIPPGICDGGERDKRPCVPDISYRQNKSLSCGPDDNAGTCVPLSRIDRFLGYKGFCLERDLSLKVNGQQSNDYNCITWYPSGDILPMEIDSFNYFESAGFSSPYYNQGGRFYCAQAEGNHLGAGRDPAYIDPEICKVIVDVRGGDPNNTIYARTDKVMNKSIPFDAGDLTSHLNYQYAHDMPPFGSASLREYNPAETGGLPWVSYSPKVCRFESTNVARIRKFCGDDTTGSCDGRATGSRGDWCQVQIVWRADNLSTPEEVICEEEGGCRCDVFAQNGGDDSTRLGGVGVCTIEKGESECSTMWGTCRLDATYNYGDEHRCRDNPNVTGDDVTYYTGGLCHENTPGCKISNELNTTCAEENGCRCGYSYLSCTIPNGSTSCSYDEKLPYGGIPWSCEHGCGTVTAPDGNPTTFDFDPNIQSNSGVLSSTDLVNSDPALNSAVERLENLFGAVRRIYASSTLSMSPYYTRQDCPSNPPFPPGCWQKITAESNRRTADLPQLSAINPDGSMVRNITPAAVQQDNTIGINGKWESGSEVGGAGGSVDVDLQFAFWTESHGPITDITVDWGDDNKFDTRNSKYKNRVPQCGGTLNNGEFFLTPAACESRPAIFKHVYVYRSDCMSHGARAHHDDEAHLDLGIPLGTQHCHYKPKVIIKDNWGYCNGVCSGGIDGSEACFDPPSFFPGSPNNECNDEVAGTEFRGEIIVAP